MKLFFEEEKNTSSQFDGLDYLELMNTSVFKEIICQVLEIQTRTLQKPLFWIYTMMKFLQYTQKTSLSVEM